MVAGSAVGNDKACPVDRVFQKSFQSVLFNVLDNTKLESFGIPFNGIDDNGLVTKLLFAKPGFIYFYNAAEYLPVILGH